MSHRQISGGGRLTGTVRMPGDKSVSHRALIFGALAEGTTEVSGLAPGADVHSTRSVLEALGVEISGTGAVVSVRGRGLGGLKAPKTELDAGNSGTTMRLMSGVLAGHPFIARIVGDESLSRRPMERVAVPLRQLGATIELTSRGTAPMTVRGGKLRGSRVLLTVASAQVKSAVLLAGLHAVGKTTVIEPEATRDHTEKMLELFGVSVERDGLAASVTGGSRLKGIRVSVPGDPSSAAFWCVAASLAARSELRVCGVMVNPTRTGFLNVLKRMGADIRRETVATCVGEPCEDLIVRSAQLRATDIKASEVPGLVDEVPILALAATCAKGRSRFSGLDELRHKESDRLAGIAALLVGFGAQAEVSGDDLIITGPTPLRGTRVDSLKDHRLAMTGFAAGLLAEGDTMVRDADCAEISYPTFYTDFMERISR